MENTLQHRLYSLQQTREKEFRDSIALKLHSKAIGYTEDGWLIMGCVRKETCGNCRLTSYTLIGRACPNCGSTDRISTSSDGITS